MRNQYTELLCGLPPSDCRFWPFITESKQRVHTAETEMAEALSKGYNSVTVTPEPENFSSSVHYMRRGLCVVSPLSAMMSDVHQDKESELQW